MWERRISRASRRALGLSFLSLLLDSPRPSDGCDWVEALPAQAVRPGGKVWVVRDGRLAIETIEVVLQQEDRVIIRRPLDGRLVEGEPVVTSPLAHTHTGMLVTQVESP